MEFIVKKSLIFWGVLALLIAGCSSLDTSPLSGQSTQTVDPGLAPQFLVGEEARLFLEKNSCIPTDAEGVEEDLDPVIASYPNASFSINAPWIPQVPPGDWNNTKNCGQTCAAMIGGYYHNYCPGSSMITAENSWLRNYTGDTRYLNANGWYTGSGTLPPLIRSYHALSVNVYYGNQPDDVVMEGYRGRPVIVAVKTRMGSSTGVPHYMVFVGFSYPYMYFHDPGRSTPENGRFVRYTISQFYASWSTQGKQYMPVF